jgi:hypothetical protein
MHTPCDTPDLQFIREAKARVKELDSEVLKAIDRRDFTSADRLDRDRTRLEKAISLRQGATLAKG